MFLVAIAAGCATVGVLAMFGMFYVQDSGAFEFLKNLTFVSWMLVLILLFAASVNHGLTPKDELSKRAEQACGQFKTEEGLSNAQKLYYRCANDPQGSWRLLVK